jgi:hypothetical protein
MPLRIIMEPIIESVVYGVVELVSEIGGQLVGEAVGERIPLLKQSYSDAYCKSFFCLRCPGMANGKRAKRGWYVYRCQDCGSSWGVLKSKPWVRRERQQRGGLRLRAI